MDKNSSQGSAAEKFFASSNIPPPPAEVTVRTMASDIASVAASGGGPPMPRSIKIALKAENKSETGQPQTSIFPKSLPAQAGPPIAPTVFTPTVYPQQDSEQVSQQSSQPPQSFGGQVEQVQSISQKRIFSSKIFFTILIPVLLMGTFLFAYFVVYPFLNPE